MTPSTTRATRALVLALALHGCAAGVATARADGSCEVRGYALGRSELAAYRARTSSDDPRAPALCARMHGGTGSSSFWDSVSAAFGALVGWWAAP